MTTTDTTFANVPAAFARAGRVASDVASVALSFTASIQDGDALTAEDANGLAMHLVGLVAPKAGLEESTRTIIYRALDAFVLIAALVRRGEDTPGQIVALLDDAADALESVQGHVVWLFNQK